MLRGISNLASNILNSDGSAYDRSGTWTPIDASGAGLSFTISGTSTWDMKGGQVVLRCIVTYPVTADTSTARIGGYPFTVTSVAPTGSVSPVYNTANISGGEPQAGGTSNLLLVGGNVIQTNANLSGKVLALEIRYKRA